MATKIFEMNAVSIGGSIVGVRRGPFLAKQSLTPTGTTQQSVAFSSSTNMITIQADEDVLVEIGNNPSATSASFKVKAGVDADFFVTGGDKVAVKI